MPTLAFPKRHKHADVRSREYLTAAEVPRLRKAARSALVPEELQGRPVVGVTCLWTGDLDAGERALAPLRSFGRPAVVVHV